MQLGFVSAVLGDLTLEEVLAFAADEGFRCVELMCWPQGKADRRYAGVTHLDVADLTPDRAAHVHDLLRIHGVSISGLGYYPNPLDPDPARRATVVEHLKKVIRAAPRCGCECGEHIHRARPGEDGRSELRDGGSGVAGGC